MVQNGLLVGILPKKNIITKGKCRHMLLLYYQIKKSRRYNELKRIQFIETYFRNTASNMLLSIPNMATYLQDPRIKCLPYNFTF